MSKSKKGTVTTIIFVVIFAAAIFGIYFYVRNKAQENAKKQAEKDAQPTEVSEILALNIDAAYPDTARTVLRLYCRIVSAMMNEDLKEGELMKLEMQLRKLFDDEFLANNTVNDQYNSLQLERLEYQDNKRKIDSYLVDTANNAEQKVIEERDYYSIMVNFIIKESGISGTLYEEFLLRRDDAGRWKIVGWRRVDKDGMTETK